MQNPTLDNTSLSSLRDHLANERTFLAWIRTNIGIMAFGFVVEKFSLFLKQITVYLVESKLPAHGISQKMQGYSAVLGILLVALGTIMCLFAFFKYKKIEVQINAECYKPSNLLDAMLALTVICVGVFLTIYLMSSI